MIGKRIGPYLIVEEIGDGGHAFVFKGMREDEPVAIKMLKPSATADESLERRFLLEVDALKNLDHPNIVGFKDYFFLNKFHYLVMEFMDAGSTDQLMRATGPVEARYAVPILNQVLAGVAHAHGLGYLHRDLKPNNILLNRRGQAKITDFGIAKVLGGESLTKKGFVLGTTAYMAPEYLTHGRDSEQLDIYALGVSSYEILSGRKPFEFEGADESVAAFAARVIKEKPTPLAAHRPVPAELERIVMKAIDQDPRKRYKTADKFRQDLVQAFPDLANRPIQILHGRPRTDVVQMRRQRVPNVGTPTPHLAGESVWRKIAGLFSAGGDRTRRAASNGARGPIPTPTHAARVPYFDEMNEPGQVPMSDASELSAWLVVTSGAEVSKRFGLRPISRVGRDLRFDIRPEDEEISRQHAVITFDGSAFSIRDLNSANGTFVNDRRVEIDQRLAPGDLIRIGNTTLRFEYTMAQRAWDTPTVVARIRARWARQAGPPALAGPMSIATARRSLGRLKPAVQALLLLLLCSLALAQDPASRPETAPTLRAPEAVFGHPCGADHKFIGWQAIVDYFHEVDRASGRVVVEEIGKSTLRRPFLAAYVSSPENLARRAEILAYNRKVALGEADPEEIRSGKFPATVLVTAGIHATEFTGTQAAPELLWRLAGGAPESERLLRDCLLVLVPSFNPDGLEIVKAWYEKTLGTPFEGTWPPELYHRFVGHDNNRDAYMLTQVESQLVNRLLYHDVHPQIYVDQHHMGNSDARMFIGEMYEPLNPSLDPLTVMNVQLVGSYMRSKMTSDGKRGLLHRANWNGFWQGGFFTNAWWHHIPAILTETASMRLASPIFQRPSDLDGAYFKGVGKSGNAKEWNHPWPWAGGWWRPRDGVGYDIAAVLAAMDAAVAFRVKLAEDRWQAARRGISDGARAPVAWLIAPDQHDVNAPRRLAAKLLDQGAVVLEATKPFEANGKSHPIGTLILPAAQPFRSVVRDFVEPQTYPERGAGPDGTPEPPFDWTGWTPAMQMGVVVERVVAWPAADVAKSEGVRKMAAAPAEVESENPATLASWRVAGRRLSAALAASAVESRAESAPESRSAVALPGNGRPRPPRRVGVYQPWTASMDEGWIRWILRQFELPYRTLHDADVRAGGLRARYDTILLPSIGARSLRDGHAGDSMPPEYCGGLGGEGEAAVAKFVREGGRLVCLDASSEYALEIFTSKELPVEEVTAKLDAKKFSCPGSLLAVDLAARTPANSQYLIGLPTELVVPFQKSRAFTIGGGDGAAPKSVEAIARYAERDLCRSGWICGPDQIAGKVMALVATVGDGQVVLFGAPVQFRAQSEASFPLLFNALYR